MNRSRKFWAKLLILSFVFVLPCLFCFSFGHAGPLTASEDTVYFEPSGTATSADGETLYTFPGGDIKININLNSVDTIPGFFIALIDTCYNGNIFLDSAKNNGSENPICFEGGRVEYWHGKLIELSQYPHFLIVGSNCEFPIPWLPCADILPPGDGPVATLTFTALDSGEIYLDTLAYHYGPKDYTLLVIHPDANAYVPVFIPRTFYVRFCPYSPGDLNLDRNVDIVDAVFLVNYLFRNGKEPCPLKSADANCDQEVTIADAVYLINYIFRSGSTPQICEY
jgi:hypothetical protein